MNSDSDSSPDPDPDPLSLLCPFGTDIHTWIGTRIRVRNVNKPLVSTDVST